MTRKKLRLSLGSRTARRAGTKSAVVKRVNRKNNPKPKSVLERLIRKAIREGTYTK